MQPQIKGLDNYESIFSVVKNNSEQGDDLETPNLIGDGSASFSKNFTHRASKSTSPMTRKQFKPFTCRHRSNLKGSNRVTTEFLFLRDLG